MRTWQVRLLISMLQKRDVLHMGSATYGFKYFFMLTSTMSLTLITRLRRELGPLARAAMIRGGEESHAGLRISSKHFYNYFELAITGDFSFYARNLDEASARLSETPGNPCQTYLLERVVASSSEGAAGAQVFCDTSHGFSDEAITVTLQKYFSG